MCKINLQACSAAGNLHLSYHLPALGQICLGLPRRCRGPRSGDSPLLLHMYLLLLALLLLRSIRRLLLRGHRLQTLLLLLLGYLLLR